MSDDLPGKDISLWIDTTERTNYPSFDGQLTECDVAIVGGGITGLLCAWHLQEAGLQTVVLEKSRLVEWTTGSTTAKLTSQHYLVYDYLVNTQGEDTARAYAQANEDGINDIEKLSNQLGINCDFSRRDAFVYTQNEETVDDIKKEVRVTQKIGLPSSYETTTDLPFDVTAAIKFSNQAQFHPRKFLLGVAGKLENGKTHIFEQTEATDISPGSPHVLRTKRGDIRAKYIVEASQYPFWGSELFDKATWTKMSYALGVRLKSGSRYPEGMYITTDQPMRTIRSHPYKDGKLLLFGGESHEYDEPSYNPPEHFINLVKDLHEKFAAQEIVYRWLAGDIMPHDRMPYIGEHPGAPGVYIITGYRAWGLAWAMSAAQVIRDKILGREVGWAKPFGLERLIRSDINSE